MDDLHAKIYDNVLLKREADNKRRDPTHNLIFQFSVGDYVLVCEEGTRSAKEKTRLTWLGPYQIIDIVSKHVYSVESLTNRVNLVRGSRLWWYVDSRPLCNRKLKAPFVHNFQSLELEKFLGIRFPQGIKAHCEIRTRWLGFDENEDTWQDFELMYQDLPVLVRRYVEDEVHDQGKRVHLLVLMENIDKKKYDTKKNRIRNLKLNKIQLRHTKLRQIDRAPEGNMLGWYLEEKIFLEALVLKYGCGCYVDYLRTNTLPFRSKQQIATQLQRLLNLQTIGIFHELKFKISEARGFLSKHFGITGMYKNLPRSLNTLLEKEHILQLFKQEVTLIDGTGIEIGRSETPKVADGRIGEAGR
eukprot:snap_masked-scaffold_3-processed-gene-2.9-mRNA-1 protein AED:1.00 eAED:1.00 QI:0/0/0/0/1/1/2/0/356